jgi:hypothetical protein
MKYSDQSITQQDMQTRQQNIQTPRRTRRRVKPQQKSQ